MIFLSSTKTNSYPSFCLSLIRIPASEIERVPQYLTSRFKQVSRGQRTLFDFLQKCRLTHSRVLSRKIICQEDLRVASMIICAYFSISLYIYLYTNRAAHKLVNLRLYVHSAIGIYMGADNIHVHATAFKSTRQYWARNKHGMSSCWLLHRCRNG